MFLFHMKSYIILISHYSDLSSFGFIYFFALAFEMCENLQFVALVQIHNRN